VILLDSNIVIYLVDPRVGSKIANQLKGSGMATCNIVKSEVLGYKDLTVLEDEHFRNLFRDMRSYPFDDLVNEKVIELRRSIKYRVAGGCYHCGYCCS
jgi:predicted nucleic acid-binding protein